MLLKFITFITSSIITSYFTGEKFNPIQFYKRIVRRLNLYKTYIHKDNIEFGTPHYDFFDHEDKSYLSNLIKIYINNNAYVYDFNKSFNDNCKYFPKLKEIKVFLNTNPYLKEINIEDFIKNRITPFIDTNDETNTYIINKIFKSRKDEGLHPEAGTLKIELIKTNIPTVKLIDNLYNELYKLNPEIMEMHFKKNILKNTINNSPYDIICFMTKLKIKGFVIEKNENNINFLTTKQDYFSYELTLNETIIDKYQERGIIDGKMLKLFIKDNIDNLNIKGQIINTKFTDIAISYQNGINGEILSTVVMEKLYIENEKFSIIQFSDDYYKFRNICKEDKNFNKKEIAYLYIWNIIRKVKYKHL